MDTRRPPAGRVAGEVEKILPQPVLSSKVDIVFFLPPGVPLSLGLLRGDPSCPRDASSAP